MDDLINRWTELQHQIGVLKAEQDAIAEKLMENMAIGEVLESVHGNKVRKCDRGNIDPDTLKASVTTAMWTKITKRVPVAALYKAEIVKGKLTKETLENATVRTKSWLEKR